MTVTTVTPNDPVVAQDSSSPFISVTELGDYLGRDLSSDAAATVAVDAACDVCRTTAGQSFIHVTNDRVTLDGPGTDALLLPEVPVISVSSVSVGGAPITDYALGENGVLLRRSYTAFTSTPTSGFVAWDPTDPTITAVSSLVWPKGRQNISVTYTHGFTDFPNDLRMVALAIASRFIIQGPALSESLGTQSIRYGVNSTDLTSGEKMILRRYKQAR